MCFVKYPHKKKKLNAAWAAKKKGKLSSSDKFLSKFFNNVKSTSIRLMTMSQHSALCLS
jgi:hypothetical protein